MVWCTHHAPRRSFFSFEKGREIAMSSQEDLGYAKSGSPTLKCQKATKSKSYSIEREMQSFDHLPFMVVSSNSSHQVDKALLQLPPF